MSNYDCPKCGSKGSLITSWEWNGWDYEVVSEKCTVCGYAWKERNSQHLTDEDLKAIIESSKEFRERFEFR